MQTIKHSFKQFPLKTELFGRKVMKLSLLTKIFLLRELEIN
jgi:hypothetical protein